MIGIPTIARRAWATALGAALAFALAAGPGAAPVRAQALTEPVARCLAQESQLRDLRQALAASEAEAAGARGRIEALQAEIASLASARDAESRLAAAEERAAALERRLEAAEGEITALRDGAERARADREAAVADLQAQLQEALTRANGAEREAAERAAEIERLVGALERARTDRDADVAALEERLRTAERERAAAQERLEAAQTAQAEAERRAEAVRQELTADFNRRMNEVAEASRSRSDEAGERIAELEAELASLASARQAAARLADAQERASAAEARVADLSTQIAALREAAEQARAEREASVAELRAQIEAVRQERDEALAALAEQQASRGDAERRVEQVRVELTSVYEARIAELEADVARVNETASAETSRLQSLLTAERTALNAARRDVDSLRQALAEAEAGAERWRTEAERLREENAALIEQIDALGSATTEQELTAERISIIEAQADARVRAAEAALARAQEALDSAEARRVRLATRVFETLGEMEEISAERDTCQANADALRADIERLRGENDSLRRTVGRLEGEVSEAREQVIALNLAREEFEGGVLTRLERARSEVEAELETIRREIAERESALETARRETEAEAARAAATAESLLSFAETVLPSVVNGACLSVDVQRAADGALVRVVLSGPRGLELDRARSLLSGFGGWMTLEVQQAPLGGFGTAGDVCPIALDAEWSYLRRRGEATRSALIFEWREIASGDDLSLLPSVDECEALGRDYGLALDGEYAAVSGGAARFWAVGPGGRSDPYSCERAGDGWRAVAVNPRARDRANMVLLRRE